MTKALPRDENFVPLNGTYTSIGTGRKTVTTHGTAVPLSATSVSCKRLEVQALYSNSDNIAVGDASVSAQVGSEQGTQLVPGGSYTVGITDISKVYIDSIVDGNGACFTYYD